MHWQWLLTLKKSCWQYKSDLFYVTLFCGSIGLRSMSEPISASFSLALNWDKKNNSFLVNPVGLTLRYFEARMTRLKPLQNKKGQKNLGYPRKKQSFYQEKDCFFLGYPKFFCPFLFWCGFRIISKINFYLNMKL